MATKYEQVLEIIGGENGWSQIHVPGTFVQGND
jgi:hypothetical protein